MTYTWQPPGLVGAGPELVRYPGAEAELGPPDLWMGSCSVRAEPSSLGNSGLCREMGDMRRARPCPGVRL